MAFACYVLKFRLPSYFSKEDYLIVTEVVYYFSCRKAKIEILKKTFCINLTVDTKHTHASRSCVTIGAQIDVMDRVGPAG